ncbi:ATP-binding protein [Actinomadura atramentaria]|uniref:ATP-binding protein n=1 Tax=Actinomadura atramentaria TaxID=1990 RepID=UPI00037D15E8|nr:DUF87 domain-containing protein [Actinomadura atramentaria]
MNDAERRALRAIAAGLDWAATAEHAWATPAFHVDGLHRRAELLITDGIEDAAASHAASPLGVVLEGEGGAGKTHLLGWVRRRVGAAGGYFFLVDFSVGGEFWELTARAMVEDLGRPDPGSGGDAPDQVVVLLRRLASLAGVTEATAAALTGAAPCTRADLDALVHGLLARDRRLIIRCADTLRALALFAAPDLAAADVGYAHLTSTDEAQPGERQAWGMSRRVRSPQEVVVELSSILALTGPSVIAVDQIDALLEHTAKSAGAVGDDDAPRDDTTLEKIAGGLMALRQTTRRTLCVLACLTSSWTHVRNQAVATASDRFRSSLVLQMVGDPETARVLIERRIAAALAGTGFTPPDPAWPVAPGAFETAPGSTPRALLKRLAAHVEACRREDAVRLLESFTDDLPPVLAPAAPSAAMPAAPPAVTPAAPPDAAPAAAPPAVAPAAPPELDALDARFAELLAAADPSGALDPAAEDAVVPRLLAAGLTAWKAEAGPAGRAFSVDPPPGHRPALHARLRQVLDERTDAQRHWAFRAIGAPHHRAVLKRLDDAFTAAGIGPDVPDRTLVVLRNARWSAGERTRDRTEFLADSGGCALPLTETDLRTFAALATLLAERAPDLDDWLRARRPASRTGLLATVLADALPATAPPPPHTIPPLLTSPPHPATRPAESPPAPRPPAEPTPPPAAAPDEPTPPPAAASPPPALPPSAATPPAAPPPAAPPPGETAPSAAPPLAAPPPAAAPPAAAPPSAMPSPNAAIPPAAPLTAPPPVATPRLGAAPLPDAAPTAGTSPPATAPPAAQTPAAAPSGAAPRLALENPPEAARVRVGERARGDGDVELDLAVLTRHTAIFAGSGSGKTVLLRRLVEECALRGVSAIVLDPNNDLARLGDPWPEPPPGWLPGDADRARAYLDGTDVVVWTPGRASGRPLSFQPLPDLAAVRDDPDELRSGIDVAVEALAPHAALTGRKAQLGHAVLREALQYFARRGGGDLTAFLGLLAEFPFEASRIARAVPLAAEMAEALTAATVNDPLFAGGGEPVDPGTLLTPPPGKRARVSVISLVGLGDERREGFAGRLQMALFSWVKRNPARDRPLGGLYVMDEAHTLVGQRSTALDSALVLSSQARKYGLGLVFATQAPKGLHNKISGSATTQFFGQLNSPAQQAAARELARAKGGNAENIGGLGRGRFYVASEGLPFVLTKTPLCLTHHPSGPLTEDEILDRARRT